MIEYKCPKHPAWIVVTVQGERYATPEEVMAELERRKRERAECEAQIREVQGWQWSRRAARSVWFRLFDWLAS